MDALYDEVLLHMERTLEGFERRVPAPQRTLVGNGFAFRYAEQSLHQAIIQKLARLVSGLHAARILLECGFIQEQGALHRMLDEFREDATFLALAVVFNNVTELHEQFLAAFYQEEFDRPDDPIGSTQKRPMVSRQKIRAYLAGLPGSDLDVSTTIAASRTIDKAFSGYVHGASPQIMEMYGGDPPGFQVSGLLGSPLYEDHRDDLWNYFYRGIVVFAFAAKAFGDDALFGQLCDYAAAFVKRSGKEDSV